MKERQEYIKIVQEAVSDFLNEDPNLLNLDVHEQSISHRIAHYVELRLNDKTLNVDCEYNKNLGEPKRIEVGELDPVLKRLCRCHVCSNKKGKLERERAFRPDIIVHKRGLNGSNTNKIAIEIKKSKFCPFDEAKLIELTGNRYEYQYVLGAFIHFYNGLPEFKWYSEGRQIIG